MTSQAKTHTRSRLSRRMTACLGGGLLLLGSVAAVAAEQATPPDRKSVTIPVRGMACMSCAATVKQTVKAMDGVSNVEVMLVKGSVKVTYAPARLSPERIVQAIDALGYEAGTPADAP